MEHVLTTGSQLNEMMHPFFIIVNPPAVVPSLIKFVEPRAIHKEKKCFPSAIRGKLDCQGVRILIMKLFFLVAFYYEFLQNTLNKVTVHVEDFFSSSVRGLVNGSSSFRFQGLVIH